MPPNSSAAIDKILEYTAVAANALSDIAAATQIPFLGRVCTLTLMIIPMVQNSKFQKDRCLRIVEDIHYLLCVLVGLGIHSEDIQSPKMLHQIAQYAVTLQKFDSCLRAQRELGTIKRLFKQSEITAQLDSCATEFKAALGIFTMKHGVGIAHAVVELSTEAEGRHQELLKLITSQTFDTLSSIGRSSLNASSGSLSVLPASPKIFHGREAELKDLVNILLADPARVAILGPGGMGKTTLAMAALHDPKVVKKYSTCYFISCDSAHTSDSLVAIIASNLGLEASRGLASTVIHHLSAGPPCLVILDNFETPWEPLAGQSKVEEFLSLLTDVPHVALLITMRGAERPSKVQWTRPFLRPLMPLTQIAARQTFIDIADEIHDDSELDQLLSITDNVPLAVQLVAANVASEGCQASLERWKLERTALLSTGYDKRSNLEISIVLSLSSPRMQSSPHAQDLLSLMSLLSDGISDLDLVQSKLPIPDILKCKTMLVRTSLAYVDHAGRFKVLAPIREYIQTARPPSPLLVQPVRKHLNELLELWRNFMNRSMFVFDLIPRLVSNLGNLHNVLQHGLDSDHADLRESMGGIISLNYLNLMMNHGLTPLMLRLPEMLEEMDDHGLHGRFLAGALRAWQFYTLPNPEKSIEEAIEHFRIIKDLDGEARLYDAIATYYLDRVGDVKKAENFYGHALSLASQCNSDVAQIQALVGLAIIEYRRGNYSEGLRLARKIHRIAVATGNVSGECSGVRWQAVCYEALGDFKRSTQLLCEGKELVARAGMQGGQFESMLMSTEAELYQLKTEYAEARHIHEVILHQTSAVLSPVEHAYSLVNIAFLDIVTGASTDLVSYNLDNATTAFRNAHHQRGISGCELYQANLMLREGHTARARAEYMRLFAGMQSTDDEIVLLPCEAGGPYKPRA
ncbi:NB-ARC domain-containing protein [Mycena venus]|uniref:NB-ARC domain-containing protein n=1 Tax=Mycena venus TaxID=2733690 RepID=A0A8H7CDN5_9AGAR|nr:NB-ARC domain-containing protein [Mycena venus]